MLWDVIPNNSPVVGFWTNVNVTGNTIETFNTTHYAISIASAWIFNIANNLFSPNVFEGGGGQAIFVDATCVRTGTIGWNEVTGYTSLAPYTINGPQIVAQGYIYTVATLPTAAANLTGIVLSVSDATSPAVGATVTGGSNKFCNVLCTGSAWVVA